MGVDPGRLVPLAETPSNDVTVYVKGFLGAGEDPGRFEVWHRTHRALVESHGWGPAAHGWAWTSGHWSAIPVPVAGGAKLAIDVYRAVRHARVAALGATVALTVGEVAARFLAQYVSAERRATDDAGALAERLDELARQHERVRIVAHSLGCRQVIEAVSSLSAERRPAEIHLCAPALVESAVAPRLPGLARQRTWIYYSPYDLVLGVAFPLVAWERALGVTGPMGTYEGLEAVDASEHFGFWVHGEYKNRFARFAQSSEVA